jgi:hypothetical protein
VVRGDVTTLSDAGAGSSFRLLLDTGTFQRLVKFDDRLYRLRRT